LQQHQLPAATRQEPSGKRRPRSSSQRELLLLLVELVLLVLVLDSVLRLPQAACRFKG
jgi:hypothetical protein